MINEIISMNGYGAYVWSAFSFTLISFTALYFVTKLQLSKEQIAGRGSIGTDIHTALGGVVSIEGRTGGGAEQVGTVWRRSSQDRFRRSSWSGCP